MTLVGDSIEVLVIVSDASAKSIRSLAEQCAELGLQQIEILTESGVIVGRVARGRLAGLRAIEGVEGVEESVVSRTL